MAKLECLIEKPLSGEWGLDDENGTGIPVLRTTNFTNEGVINYEKIVTRIISSSKLKDKFLRYGDIILEKSGGSEKQPVGRVVFLDGENDRYLFNNFTTVLRVRDTSVINSKYLFYVLFYNYFSGGTKKLQSKTTGLHNLHLTNFIKSVDIPLVSLSQQVKIVKKFDTINSIIAKRKLQLSKLDQLVKARFVEMFGDPESNPLAWKEEKLEGYVKLVGGYTFKSEGFAESGIPVLRIGNINAGFFKPDNLVFWRDDDDLEKYKIFPGDLVMSLTGTVGKEDYGNVCILDDTYSVYYLNQRNAKIRLSASLNKIFLAEILKFSKVKKKLTGISRGIRQANISNADIYNLRIPIPPINLQEEFASFVQRIDKTKTTVKQSLEKLETLKKSLMQEYFG